MKLKNKIALVTGAAVGPGFKGLSVGSSVAFKLASEGAGAAVNGPTRGRLGQMQFAPVLYGYPAGGIFI